jgi:hypothetical protein
MWDPTRNEKKGKKKTDADARERNEDRSHFYTGRWPAAFSGAVRDRWCVCACSLQCLTHSHARSLDYLRYRCCLSGILGYQVQCEQTTQPSCVPAASSHIPLCVVHAIDPVALCVAVRFSTTRATIRLSILFFLNFFSGGSPHPLDSPARVHHPRLAANRLCLAWRGCHWQVADHFAAHQTKEEITLLNAPVNGISWWHHARLGTLTYRPYRMDIDNSRVTWDQCIIIS